MVLEHAVLEVVAGKEAAFEDAAADGGSHSLVGGDGLRNEA